MQAPSITYTLLKQIAAENSLLTKRNVDRREIALSKKSPLALHDGIVAEDLTFYTDHCMLVGKISITRG